MVVTAIREYDKKRSEVLTDGGLRFVLYQGELRRYGLREGEVLAEDAAREILTVLLPKRAKLRAMNLLKARDYTEARLRGKLQEGGYPPEVVEEAMDYVRSYRYVDDERYARDFIRCRMERESRAKLTAGLLQRGIGREIVEEAMEELYGDALLAREDPELVQIRRLLEKKRYDRETASYEERQKLLASIARRGFSADKVRRVMEEM